MRRFGQVIPQSTMGLIKHLGLGIPRLHLGIVQRPSGCFALNMLQGREILGAVAQQNRAVELGIAAGVVVIARVKGLARLIQPGFV